MPVINILDENIINKIAAGEVIERPASVIKELMENSVDAKSTFITVEIENAGKKLIKITDNGLGMDKQDAVLALQRHATSKIKDSDDLESILTFGFRGEALASISAISNFKLVTKTKEETSGTLIEVRGGTFQNHSETVCNPGTTIEVRNIFFNTPARKKYLKTSQTELSNIIDTFVNIALPENNIHFKLFVDGKEIYNLPPVKSIYEKIFLIYGKGISEKLIYIENEVQGIKLYGWFSKPELNKKTRKYQNLFVNNRYVRNISITYAVEAPYRTLLPKNMYPVYFIFLDINPNLVDINVHPAKREIKFSNDYFIKSFITKSISDIIYKKDLSYDYVPSQKNKNQFGRITFNQTQKNNSAFESAKIVFDDSTAGSLSETQNELEERNILPPLITGKSEEKFIEEGIYIGQLFNTYLIFQEKDNMLLIDQHALHEKILYERIKKNIENKKIPSQMLLIPVNIEMPKKDIELLEKNLTEFEKSGFTIEIFGSNSIILRSVPTILGKRANDKKIMIDLIDEIIDNKTAFSKGNLIDMIISSAACRAAVKAGDKMLASEAIELIKQAKDMKLNFFCPHGRPAIVKMNKTEIEKNFLR